MGWLKVLEGNEEEKFFWHPDVPEEVRPAGENLFVIGGRDFWPVRLWGREKQACRSASSTGRRKKYSCWG